MKKRIVTVCLVLASFTAFSQAPKTHEKNQNLEAAKVGIITTNLELTTEQAQSFWPVYNAYSKEKKTIKKSMKEIHSREMKTDQDYLKTLDEITSLRESEVALDKDYKDKFLKVITPKQLVSLYRSEHKFKKMLLHKLGSKQGGHGKDGMPHPAGKGPKDQDPK